MTKTENLVTDLRPLLDPKRWRASLELQELLKRPLARPKQIDERLSKENQKRAAEQQGKWCADRYEHKQRERVGHDGCSVVSLNEFVARRSRKRFE